jgi:hypothetical protein
MDQARPTSTASVRSHGFLDEVCQAGRHPPGRSHRRTHPAGRPRHLHHLPYRSIRRQARGHRLLGGHVPLFLLICRFADLFLLHFLTMHDIIESVRL